MTANNLNMFIYQLPDCVLFIFQRTHFWTSRLEGLNSNSGPVPTPA